MVLTRSSEYAIELIIYLVTHAGDRYTPLHQIARETNLSFHFLGKISQMLVHGGLVRTYRGPNGGVALAKPARKISLFDIINIIEGDAFLNQCILRPNQCDPEKPCPFHELWEKIHFEMEAVFNNVTMDQFLEAPLADTA